MNSGCGVLLVVPPFASVAMPMLGPSLLKARLLERGISAKVVYANVEVATSIGLRLYQQIAESDVRDLIGERIVATGESNWQSAAVDQPTEKSLPPALRCLVTPVALSIASAAEAIAASRPNIVGFSSTFQQNVASILIARKLRSLLPNATLVIGGANVDVPMGNAFLNLFPTEFDFVFSGEADEAFPSFCSDALNGRAQTWPTVVECPPVGAVHFSGIPDFDDYFEDAEGGKIQDELLGGERTLPIELSRGCWWGEKHHCTFCGLNANGMSHRGKTPEAIRKEISALILRYQPKRLFGTDNILPAHIIRDKGRLAGPIDKDTHYFFETKSNLNASDLDNLVRKGIWEIQPGIESLSTTLLRDLRKGNTAANHVCLLREAASRQIHVTWNLLVDIPGDQEFHYLEMLALIPKITHLQPPTGCTPIRIDRYSPYHRTPTDFRIRRLSPLVHFATVFGETADARDMCYFFDGDYDSAYRTNEGLRHDINIQIGAWKSSWIRTEERRSLVGLRDRKGDYVILDQTGRLPPRVTCVQASHEGTLFKSKRPLPLTALVQAEREMMEFYEDLGVVTVVDDHFVYLPTEPETGFHLRDEIPMGEPRPAAGEREAESFDLGMAAPCDA